MQYDPRMAQPPLARRVLAELLDLTAEGEALHRSLREYVAGPTIRLLSQFEAEDVETTVRTLQAVTARAKEEL